MGHGFIYVLKNVSMPKIYKIGYTMRHPKERIAELSAVTACPTPFVLLGYFGTKDPEKVERSIHSQLWMYRVSTSREFFDAPLKEIYDLFSQYFEGLNDVVYMDILLDEMSRQQKFDDRVWAISYFYTQSVESMPWPEPIRGLD